MKSSAFSQPTIISVIIPTYNCSDTFEDCLKSVLEQDFEEKEIIVVDGGSIDGTLDLLKEYSNQVDKWISEPDQGIYDALNKGINLAHGEWLYFLGADDKLYDNHVLSDIPLHKTKSRMIYGNVFLKNNGVIGPAGSVYDGHFDKNKLAQKNICHQAIFYKKELFKELGKFDMKYPLLADWAFNMKVFGAENTKPFFIERIIAIYDNKGLSDKDKDANFLNDREDFVKKYLGLQVYYLLLFYRSKTYRFTTSLLRRLA